MTDQFLVKLFEHHNWANEQILQACAALSDEQLDAAPQSATKGSIRKTLVHLVSSQHAYLSILKIPVESRPRVQLSFNELQESVRLSGERLLALVRDEADKISAIRVQPNNGYIIESWVLIVQIINHATEHREQIKSMLSGLGITPPEIDGWSYGEVRKAGTKITEDKP
jgi:uncharacterized damage-inducible protein DinB